MKYHGRSTAQRSWVIQAEEESPRPGASPICSRLLSKLPVPDASTAALQVRRYSQRWEIEVFHKNLKSGCKAEARQLETAERLKRCLTLDLIVAWRVLILSKAGCGEHVDRPASDWLADGEWQALWGHVHHRTDPRHTPRGHTLGGPARRLSRTPQ